jgi:hypothetical protein
MDIRFFFEQRLGFIKQLYLNGSAPFEERKRRIENEEEPFIPPYSEDGEPPFISEWLEADASIQVLGSSCLSMLSAALHLYLTEWQKLLGDAPGPPLKSIFRKKGWPNGYKAFYEAHGSERFDTGPFNFDLIVELVLARNSIQHPDSLIFDTYRYTGEDLAKMPSPFFISDREKEISEELTEEGRSWLMRPHIHIDTEKFHHALTQISSFIEWLENQGEMILHNRYLERKRLREQGDSTNQLQS